MKRILPLLLLSMLFSCTNKEAVFSENFKNFPENRWKIDDMKVFKPVLNEDINDANAYLYFSYVYKPGYNNVPVAIQWYGPDGKEEVHLIELKLEDENGEALGDCTGDVCEIKVPIKKDVNLAKGNYKIAVMHKFNGEYLPNVLAVGVSIESAE